MNTTHMHLRTHPKPESLGQAGRWQSPYHDTMIDHDKLRRRSCSTKLDELGIAEDTIVIYSTDNGPHMNTWPDGGMTPFRSEKNTNWEGAFRVPGDDPLARARSRQASVSNEIVQHHDWLPTFLAAAGRAGHRREAARPATTIGDTTFKVHIDGYNLLPYLTGEADKSPRPGVGLLLRRRRRARAPVRQLEGRLHGAADAGDAADLGRSRSLRCASRSCSTCAPIRSSAPT